MNCRALLSTVVTTLLFFCSCGGGGSGNSTTVPVSTPTPTPAPAQDFSVSLEAPTVSAQQGGALQLQSLQLSAINGFTGTVSVTLSGLPAGMMVTPDVSFSISVSNIAQNAVFYLGASSTTPVGTTTVTATATSGSITHTATFSLTIRNIAPFSIQAAPSALSITPGTLTNVQVSVTAPSGNSPQLLVNVSSPPNNSQLSIFGPQGFLTSASPVSFSITASSLAQPLQDFPLDITASDTSNNTSRVAIPLTVTVPFSTNTAPTRSTFFRTDRSPTGIVYDSLRKLVFVSVEVLNEVEVLSSVDGHQIASISTGYPAGIDEAADGSAIYVVSPLIDGVTIIDPDSLQVVGHQSVPKSVSGAQNPVAFFQIAALSNGKVLLNEAFSDFSVPGKTLYFWEPKMGTFSLVGSIGGAPQFWISRSADHSKAISACLALSGFLYDANTDLFTPVSFIGSAVSINSDGSQIASINTQNNSPYITFYDGSFNVTGTLLLAAFWNGGTVPQILFSLDGKHLYIIQDESIGVGVPGGAVTVVDAKNFSLIGLVPAFSFGASIPFTGNVSTSFALDETNMLFGAANGGVGFLDLTSPTALSEPLPQALLLQPTLASLMKPTQSQLTGVGFSQGSALSLYVGAPPSSAQTLKATNVHVQNDNFVNLTIPPGAVPGPSNATFTRSDGFFEILPDAIAFGPTLLSVDPDSGSQAGGDSIKISGFGLDAVNTQVLIGENLPQ